MRANIRFLIPLCRNAISLLPPLLARISVSIGLVSFLAAACSYQDESNCGHVHTTNVLYPVSPASKSKFPYKNFEQITFVSDSNDTAAFEGGAVITTNEVTVSPTTTADCGDLPKYRYHYEKVKIDFSSGNPLLTTVGFSMHVPVIYHPNIDAPDFGVFLRGATIASDAVQYIEYKEGKSEDSILLDGKYQRGVWLGLERSTKAVLFNFEKGILKFDDPILARKWTRYR